MTQDDHDTLEVLRAELNFIEKGGYGRPVKSPWQPTSIFQDSPTCLNFADLGRTYPCSQCALFDFIPQAERSREVPCHHIPLNDAGQTVDELEWKEDQLALEDTVKNWLRATIKRLEKEQAKELLRWIT